MAITGRYKHSKLCPCNWYRKYANVGHTNNCYQYCISKHYPLYFCLQQQQRVNAASLSYCVRKCVWRNCVGKQ